MAHVVVGGFLGQPGADRQDRRGPVQRLDLRLFIDTDHHRLVGRVEIQPDHITNLGVQLGVGGELERLAPPRLQGVPVPPDPGHRGERNTQMLAQQPSRPVRDPQRLGRSLNGRDHHRDIVDHRRTTRAVQIAKRRYPAGLIPVAPLNHRRTRNPHPASDFRVRHPLGSQQHDPRPLRQSSLHR